MRLIKLFTETETATDYSDKPLENQVMKTVTVDTFGVDYPEPEKL